MAQLAAAIIPSAIGAISSLFGGNKQGNAAVKASGQVQGGLYNAKNQLQSASDFNQWLQGQDVSGFQTASAKVSNLFQPYIDAGSKAVGQLGSMNSQDILNQNPGYQFALDQGSQAIQRGASAQGTALTGGELKDLTSYAQGNALGAYQQAFSNLFSIAGMGQQAAGSEASNQFGTAGAIQNAHQFSGTQNTGIQSMLGGIDAEIGKAGAAGTLGQTSSLVGGTQGAMSGIGSILSNPDVLKALSGLFGGGE